MLVDENYLFLDMLVQAANEVFSMRVHESESDAGLHIRIARMTNIDIPSLVLMDKEASPWSYACHHLHCCCTHARHGGTSQRSISPTLPYDERCSNLHLRLPSGSALLPESILNHPAHVERTQDENEELGMGIPHYICSRTIHCWGLHLRGGHMNRR